MATALLVVPIMAGYQANHFELMFPQIPPQNVYFTEPPKGCRKQDLGQARCMKYMDDGLQPLLDSPNIRRIIVLGESQGSATVINWMAAANRRNRRGIEKIACLVLISVLASGNLTSYEFAHTMCCCCRCWCCGRRGKRACEIAVPTMAKTCCFPDYDVRPTAQPLYECLDLPREVPIILVNSIKDCGGTPLEGARAIWTRIFMSRKPTTPLLDDRKVYLLTVDRPGHLYPLLHDETALYSKGGGTCYNTHASDYPNGRFLFTFWNLQAGKKVKHSEAWYRFQVLLQHVGLPSALDMFTPAPDSLPSREVTTPDLTASPTAADIEEVNRILDTDRRVSRHYRTALLFFRFGMIAFVLLLYFLIKP